MPEQFAGRLLRIKDAGVAIAGLRTKSAAIGNEPINITTDDDLGFRKLLLNAAGTNSEVSEKQIDISFDGITQDDTLIKAAMEGTALVKEYVLEFPSGATVTVTCVFTSMEITGTYQDSQTFSGELQSTGVWVYADAP